MEINHIDKVIVIGAGGIGSILLPPLARYLYSQNFQGKLTIVDGDKYSDSNRSRQNFSYKFVGENKAKYQAQALLSHMPELTDVVEYIDKYLGKNEINQLIDENCIVITAVDNIACRKFVEDRCEMINNVIHIVPGNDLKTGQVQLSVRKDGKRITPTIFERMPKLDSTNDDRSKMSCEDLAKLPSGGQLISANMMAAALALNYFIIATSGHDIYQGGNYAPNDMVSFDCSLNAFDVDGVQDLNLNDVREYKKNKNKEVVNV